MKVVLVSRYPHSYNTPRGGVESVTLILARALADLAGIDVHVVTIEKGHTETRQEQDGAVTIHRLPGSHCPQIFDIVKGPGKKRIHEKIKELSPDIVHYHETYGLIPGNLNVPQVFTVHGFDHANVVTEGRDILHLRSKLWQWMENYGLARQKVIISISPYVRNMIEQKTSAPIYDIDNPVDGHFFSLEPNCDERRVLCVGWINERKNTLGSVKAFIAARKQGAEGKLVIAGHAKDSEYRKKIDQEIIGAGIEDHVEFLGHVNREQLTEQLALASCLLLPSLQENAPMAISEAMASSVAVVASNRCGMPFMVEDGRSGFLVDPLDTEQIGRCLARVLGDPDICTSFGQAGREIARQRFHPETVARKTVEVYKQHLL